MKGIRERIEYWRYAIRSRRVPHPRFAQASLLSDGYSSQCGQDKWIVEELFPGKRSGTFVDVGAHDGVTFSNTLFLEKQGWTGLAIEPMPTAFKKLQRTRSCRVVNACIGSTSGSRRFRWITGYSEMLSGVADEYDPRHLARISREIEERGGEIREIEVACYSLDALLSEHQISSIDYLSIDVEGSELAILREFPFARYRIEVIGVENNYHDPRIALLLTKHGFGLHSVVGDEFYVRQNRGVKSA